MSNADPSRLFCFGLGFSARVLARRLKNAGWSIAGTTRSADKAAALKEEGIEAFVFDREHPLAGPGLAATTHLLISIAPDELGDPVLGSHAADIASLPELRWIGYLSTTGVYGDWQGAEVDETSELRGAKGRNRRRIEAEAAWLALQARQGLPVHVFRLAGIYGPGRSTLDQVRAGRAKRIDKPGQVFGRIHVADLATVLEASIARPRPGGVYNVCDDDPAPPAEVIAHACALLEVPPPPLVPFEAAELSDLARSFYRDSKRVSNRRIKEELGVRLAYPGYREGLAALLAAERS